jgi:class 3 adenylate cyclase/CHASE2 domain-containing sensor protein
METRSKKNFLKSNLDILLLAAITAVFTALAGFGVLQKLDYRLYDMLLGTKKEAKSDKSILFVEIDDPAIQAIGAWPWSRDVLGDALIRMKELGASKAVFDIEYLSKSQYGVDPDAVNKVADAFSQTESDISEYVGDISNAVSSGNRSKAEVPSLLSDLMSEGVDPMLQNLYSGVTDSMYRDNDTYFAHAVQFFGDTWLTIGTRDASFKVTDEDRDYVYKRFLYRNITDKKQLIRKSNEYTATEQDSTVGFQPAIHQIIDHASGAGFTNVFVDKDGTRRRIELLTDYDGQYVAQLVFAPFLRMVDADSVERKGNKLIVHNALLPGSKERTTIRIPLDEHGRMMINWLHSSFPDSFRHESVMFLNELDKTEANIVLNLSYFANELEVRDAKGHDLAFKAQAEHLAQEYAQITELKKKMLSNCLGYNDDGSAIDGGVSEEDYAAYFAARTQYFKDVNAFLAADHKELIFARLDELEKDGGDKDTIDKVRTNVAEILSVIESDVTLYDQEFEKLKGEFTGSFCIIGDTATATTDLGVTPFERGYANVGTHANVLNTILQQDFITPANWLWGIVIAFFSVLLVLLFTRKFASEKQNLFGVVYVVVTIGSIMLLMIIWGVYIPILAPALIVVSTYIAETLLHFVAAEKDKSFLRRAFSTYLSKDVVNVIVKDPTKLTLGGEDKHITALFSDVRSFSSFSELVTPTKLVSVLNVYLGQLSDAIMDNHGTIDKYIGDEIVSFFGAPLDIPDHAYCACVAGIRMKQVEAAYNKEHLASGDIPRELESRVGINTGNMVVGNMGTEMKMNYTIMGNDVNLASRLEGVNKMYHSWILASEQTWNEANSGVHEGKLLARRFDRVRVVGINKPVQLYNILGFKDELSEDQKQSVEIFHDGLDKYLKRDFQGAGKRFIEANKCFPSDESPLVFAARCKDYLSTKLPDDWDGVINMTSK